MSATTRDEAAESGEPFHTRTAHLGQPHVDLDHALQLAGELEDEELIRKMKGVERNR